jgi:uncharacterized membrane protein
MIASAATSGLVFVALLAGSIWVGGFVAIVVVARVARAQLDHRTRISFFRDLGRRYLVVGLAALLAALSAGAVLLSLRPWDATSMAAVLVGLALVLATVAGIVQARAMTRARARAVQAPQDADLAQRVRRGSFRAVILRAIIGGLTLGLLALAAALAT